MSFKSFKALRLGFISLLKQKQYSTKNGKKGRHLSPNKIKQLINIWKLGNQAIYNIDSNILII